MLRHGTTYLAASLVALGVLQVLLDVQHASSLTRAPEVLLLASLMLAILQGYGLTWAERAPGRYDLPGTTHAEEVGDALRDVWFSQSARDFFPVVTGFLVLVHFLFRQSADLNAGHVASLAGTDALISDTLYVVIFLLGWLAATYFFHIGTELDQVDAIEQHLQKVSQRDFGHQTDTTRTWGLWKAISEQLNRFSRQVGDNTRQIDALTEEKLAAQAEAIAQKQLAIDTLTHHREQLEIAVAERTRDLVDTQAKLVASEKMAALGIFTAGMAHEINNPANFVSAGAQNARAQLDGFSRFLDELLDQETDPEIRQAFAGHFGRLNESLNVVYDGIRRIESVVSQLRAHHPEGQTGHQPADVITLLEAVWRLLSASLTIPVSLTTQLTARPSVPCSVADIEQVFLAILKNAIHAIEDAKPQQSTSWNGEITLSSHISNNALVIVITDNGVGILDADIDRIFDPFFTTKSVGRGAGLGLSMARDVVRKHHGTLDVTSKAGQGSIFQCRLPLDPPA
jgi:signal transduction histidine kinase